MQRLSFSKELRVGHHRKLEISRALLAHQPAHEIACSYRNGALVHNNQRLVRLPRRLLAYGTSRRLDVSHISRSVRSFGSAHRDKDKVGILERLWVAGG